MRRRLALLALLATEAAGCGRQAPVAEPSVSERQGRSVAECRRLGWLSSERETGALPSAVALGGKTSGRVLLYFEFPELETSRQLLQAQLLLSPLPSADATVEVELSRAESARGDLNRWSDQPRALYPRLARQLTANQAVVRLDVTEIARAHARPGEPLRLLLRAEPGEAEGVLIATGADGGAAPRLELYWQ